MAKRTPSRKHQTSQSSLQFIFPAGDLLPDGYLDEFTSRINSEKTAGFSVCVIGTAPEKGTEDKNVTFLPDDPDKILNSVGEGYDVIFEASVPRGQINPGEFFRLELPEANTEKVFWEFKFSGKTGSHAGGIILPSDALKYILVTRKDRNSLAPGKVRAILGKLGFRKETAVIHQENPFGEPRGTKIRFADRIGLALAWNTFLPLKEARHPGRSSWFFTRENPLFRLVFVALALGIFILLPILSRDAGLSGDDEKHYQHAIKVYRYYTEGDKAALDDPQYKLNYYGQSFDFFTYLVIRALHLEEDPYEARHVMVALAGAAAILFTGLLVKLFAGYSGGSIAMALMFLSPRFLGHAFNNPMDIPFALGNIFTLYYLILFLRKLPRFNIGYAICIALGIGWTNGIRIGGLLLIPYLFMFSGLYLLIHKWPWKFFSKDWWNFAMKGLGILVLISAAGYLLSVLTWPYALQDIINHPIKSFQIMTNIQVSIRVLYDGIVQWSDRLPWHYIPKNILLTVPVLILLGWFASAVTWYTDRKEGNGFWYFMLWFTILFPILFIIYRESNVYGGWRHMMFVYPSMVALSALAISSLLRRSARSWMRFPLYAVLLAGILHPLRHEIVNHPNTYIYFNEWSGGINHTYGTFETDYYANSLRPASDVFIQKVLPEIENREEPVKIVSNFDISYYFRDLTEKVQPLYSRYYDRGNYDWDYAILYCNYIHPYQLRNGLWPPKNTIQEIRVDTVVVAAIVERKNREDYYGYDLLQEGMEEQNGEKLEQARNFLQDAVNYDPNNEAALLELGNSYGVFSQFDEARQTMDQLLNVYPDYDKALNLKGYTYMLEFDYNQDPSVVDMAIYYINLAIRSNYKFYSGYYNLGLCYWMKNDLANAEYNFRLALKYNGRFIPAYEKLAELYDFAGDNESASQVRAQMESLR